MSEEGDQVIAEAVRAAMDNLGSVVVFSQAELPGIMSQVLLWHTVQGVLAVLIALLTISAMIAVTYRLYRQRPEEGGEKSWAWDAGNEMTMGAFTLVAMLVVVSIVTLLVALDGVMNIIQIQLAPRLYLLEYGASLLGQN